MNLICYLIGHKPESFTDSGYKICNRCKSHEYYDNYKKQAILFIPYDKLMYALHDLKCWFKSKFFKSNELPF